MPVPLHDWPRIEGHAASAAMLNDGTGICWNSRGKSYGFLGDSLHPTPDRQLEEACSDLIHDKRELWFAHSIRERLPHLDTRVCLW